MNVNETDQLEVMDSGSHYLQHIKDLQQIQPYILNGVVPTGRQLGHGAFGSVIEMRMVGGELCAGKKIHDALFNPQNVGVQTMIEKFISECDLMSKMRHPNIVNFYGLVFLSENSAPILVMELMDRSLEDYLERIRSNDIAFSIRILILYDVAKGLAFLHSCSPPIIHRDLTARNILLSTTKQARIADLGNSRIINAENLSMTLSQTPGTALYMPPEAFEFQPHYDASLDMFSYGHVSLYTLTHVFPSHLLPATYPDPNDPRKLLARSEIQRRSQYVEKLEANEMIPSHLSDMVKACLENIPQHRPTAKNMADVLEEILKGSETDYPVMIRNFDLSGEIEAPPTPGTGTMEKRRASHLMTRITVCCHITRYKNIGKCNVVRMAEQISKKHRHQVIMLSKCYRLGCHD